MYQRKELTYYDGKLLIICVFVGIIHMIETLAYSVRLAGLKTGKLVVALSLLILLSLFQEQLIWCKLR